MRAALIGILFAFSSHAVAAESALKPFSGSEKLFTTGIASAAIVGGFIFGGPEDEARWTFGIPGDKPLSQWIGRDSRGGTEAFKKGSDWGVAATMLTSFFFTGDAGGDGRWQAVQSFAVTGLATTTVKSIAGRERPYVSQCRDNELGQDCFSGYRNESFLSGHSAFAFTGAGLICAFRSDVLCPLGIGVAASTAAFRVAGNQHFVTDVIAGAALGWMSGYSLPKWRSQGSRSSSSSGSLAVSQNGAFGYALSFAIP